MHSPILLVHLLEVFKTKNVERTRVESNLTLHGIQGCKGMLALSSVKFSFPICGLNFGL